MPSSYTTSLRLTLPATGELAGQWGNTVNTGITELLDAAVAGTASISTWGGAGVAYTLSNNSGTADEARKMFIVATGSPGEAKNVICPAVSKFYVFRNDTTGGYALTLKTPSGTGISVPAGQYKFLYCDGTNVVEMFNSVASLRLSSLTSGRVTYAGTAGLLQDSANFTFNGTDLTVSGAVNAGSVNATTLDLTNLEVTNIKAKDGTASASIADSTGVMSLVANPVFSGGTANGVLYLNGSKVATSGSALTFDGTTLTQTASTPVLGLWESASGNFNRLLITQNAGLATYNQTYSNNSTNAHVWQIAGTEYARLTSTGLGIGTSSPTYKLDISVTTNNGIRTTSSAGQQAYLGNTGGEAVVGSLNNYGFGIITNGSLRGYFDTSGNLGIGTTNPSAYGLVAVNGASASVNINATTGAAAFKLYEGAGTGRGSVTSLNGANGLAFLYGTTEGMRLDASGNLGLGVTPSYRLHVQGTPSQQLVLQSIDTNSTGKEGTVNVRHYTNTEEPPLIVGGYSASTDNYVYVGGGFAGSNAATQILFYTAANTTTTVGTERARIDSAGNLGLGVTPSAWVGPVNATGYKAYQAGLGSSFGGTSTVYGYAFVASNAYATGNDVPSVATWRYMSDTAPSARYEQNDGQHRFYTAPSGTAGNSISFTQAMTLDASGNLQVGTSSGTFINGKGIVIADATAARLKLADTDAGVGTSNGLELGFGGAIGSIYNLENGALLFGTNNTERARITSGGDLLVGTTSTTSGARLDVKGVDSTASNYCMFFENSSSALLLAVQNDGRWRSGTAAASPYNYTVGATNRDLFVDNLGEIGYVSSVRASKTNISSVSNVDWLLRLNPVTFNFRKKDTEGNYIEEADGPLKHGLIAEEVEAVNPDLCFYDDADKGGELRGVNYTHLITPMLKLLQELKAQNDELRARVAALEAQP